MIKVLGKFLYTWVPVSVLVRLLGPPPMDSYSVQLCIRTFVPKSLDICTCTDTEAIRNLVCGVLDIRTKNFDSLIIRLAICTILWGPGIRTIV